mmetsp:Transcript_3858/g.7212  ORF Transcript_3858/g.7212 Transcript_3858/m.7212 type:complete len:431 (-) Transcript_3858:439-1731(-)
MGIVQQKGLRMEGGVRVEKGEHVPTFHAFDTVSACLSTREEEDLRFSICPGCKEVEGDKLRRLALDMVKMAEVKRREVDSEEEEGRREEDALSRTKSQVICDLLTAAAGLNSTDPTVQAKVQAAITSLLATLPDMRKGSEKMQAMLQSVERARVAAEVEEKGEEEEDKARTRAAVLEKLLHPDHVNTPFAVQVIEDVRKRVGGKAEQMLAELRRKDDEAMQQSIEEGDASPASYLISTAALETQKIKVIVTHLLDMSAHISIDLTSLPGHALNTLFKTDYLTNTKLACDSALHMLQKYRGAIESRESQEPNSVVRTSTGLASLLSGRVPNGIQSNADVAGVFESTAVFASLPPTSTSPWHVALRGHWSLLETKHKEWVQLEEQADSILASDDADAVKVTQVMQDIVKAGLLSTERMGKLKAKLHSLVALM